MFHNLNEAEMSQTPNINTSCQPTAAQGANRTYVWNASTAFGCV